MNKKGMLISGIVVSLVGYGAIINYLMSKHWTTHLVVFFSLLIIEFWFFSELLKDCEPKGVNNAEFY